MEYERILWKQFKLFYTINWTDLALFTVLNSWPAGITRETINSSQNSKRVGGQNWPPIADKANILHHFLGRQTQPRAGL